MKMKKMFYIYIIVLICASLVYSSEGTWDGETWDEDVWKQFETNPDVFQENIQVALEQDSQKSWNIIENNPNILNDQNSFEILVNDNPSKTWGFVDNKIEILESSPSAFDELKNSVSKNSININEYPNLKEKFLEKLSNNNKNFQFDTNIQIDSYNSNSNTISSGNSLIQFEGDYIRINGIKIEGEIEIKRENNLIKVSSKNNNLRIQNENYPDSILRKGSILFTDSQVSYTLAENSIMEFENRKTIQTAQTPLKILFNSNCNEENCYSHNGNFEILYKPINQKNLRIEFNSENSDDLIFKIAKFEKDSNNEFSIKTGQGSEEFIYFNDKENNPKLKVIGSFSLESEKGGPIIVSELGGELIIMATNINNGVYERVYYTANPQLIDNLKSADEFRENEELKAGITYKYSSFSALSKEEKTKRIMQDLMDAGYSKVSAAAILGNLLVESSNFEKYQETDPKSGRGGFGWAQWTGVRRDEFEAWSAKNNLKTTDYDANLGYLLYEMETAKHWGSGHKRKFLSMTDPEAAAVHFRKHFERPAINHDDRRKKEARFAYSLTSN